MLPVFCFLVEFSFSCLFGARILRLFPALWMSRTSLLHRRCRAQECCHHRQNMVPTAASAIASFLADFLKLASTSPAVVIISSLVAAMRLSFRFLFWYPLRTILSFSLPLCMILFCYSSTSQSCLVNKDKGTQKICFEGIWLIILIEYLPIIQLLERVLNHPIINVQPSFYRLDFGLESVQNQHIWLLRVDYWDVILNIMKEIIA